MGLTVKNKNNFELSEDISSFFSLPINEPIVDDYETLKKQIYALKIDSEEKANIINKINSLNQLKTMKETTKIKKDIESFKEKYNL